MTSASELPGIGVDLELTPRWDDPDLRLFTPAEVAHCQRQGNPAESFAGRWCAKEAVVKAFGARASVSVRDVEIFADDRGAPVVRLAARLASSGWCARVSIAHQPPVAIAIAVVDGPAGLAG
jgi:phosphopantetheine--protein transferase-like protein